MTSMVDCLIDCICIHQFVDFLDFWFEWGMFTLDWLIDWLFSLISSPTEALLWLKRSLTFIDIFLAELLTTEKETGDCASLAYKISLQPHHGFVVRAAFSAALYSALPRRKDFIAALAERKEDAVDPVYTAALMEDAREYSVALRNIVIILNQFYTVEKLDWFICYFFLCHKRN